MRARAVVVERSGAEQVRRWLAAGGHLRGDVQVRREGDRVLLPVQGELGPPPPGLPPFEVEEREFDLSGPRRPTDYRELLQERLPPPLHAHLPSAFDVIGEIVLVRLPPELEPYRRPVGEALREFVPGCRLVGWDRGVEGAHRLRRLERLAGEGPWTTAHRENGLVFEVDLEGAYFSPRLAREHARVADQVHDGERVLDLFCGIAPFAITLLTRRPQSTAVAVDLNPVAIELARTNARRAKVADRLDLREASAETFQREGGTFRRVIANLPREGTKYAPLVASHVMVGGTLHHYEVIPRSDLPDRLRALASELEAAAPGPWRLEAPHLVHPFSPRADLLALTAHRGS